MSARLWQQLFALRPATHQWPGAVQAATAITVPPSLGLLLGEPRWGSVASIGALIVLHLPDRSRRERAVALPVVAVALLVAASIGAALGTALIPGLIAMSAIAIGGSLLAQALNVGPPGALFLVLITGSAGQLVAPVSKGGAGMSYLEVTSSLAGGALVGYLVVVLPLTVPAIRASDQEIFARRAPWRFAVPASVRVVVARIAVAAVMAVPVSAFCWRASGSCRRTQTSTRRYFAACNGSSAPGSPSCSSSRSPSLNLRALLASYGLQD